MAAGQKSNIKSKEAEVNFKKAKVNIDLSSEEKLDMYRLMIRIRRFEERCIRSYQQGHIGGFCHTYIGEEAVGVGTISLLGKDDHIVNAYRIHGHALAVGMSMKEIMAEMYGKQTGCSQGKGGSMHFMATEKNFWGGHGIVGGQTPLGAGIAFALKYQKKKGACLCYLGDGAVNQGAFYESLNLAGLWDLPTIYIIENNQFSMGTSQERSSAGAPLAKRAEGYGIEWAEVQGNDVYEVRAKTAEALSRAHEESRPTVLEIHTYRYRGHSMSDPDQTYRTKDDINKYKAEQDCIALYEKSLLDDGILDEKRIKEINTSAKSEAEEAADFADQSPYPPVSSIQDHVYWETDNPEERLSQGTMFFNKAPEE